MNYSPKPQAAAAVSPAPDVQSNVQIDPAVAQQLSSLSQLMNQMVEELQQLREQVNQITDLPAQVQQLEQRLMVVGDLYRYEALHDYLKTQQWFKADKETVALIANIAGVSELEALTPQDIRRFPCGELQVIDRLWSHYSEGQFGFSVQLKQYQELGGSLNTLISEDQALIQQWGAQLGWRDGVTAENPKGDRWRQCDELEFSLKAPQGCHPSRWWNSPYGSRMTNYFLSRLLFCSL